MNPGRTEVFLASRFEEFKEVRERLWQLFEEARPCAGLHLLLFKSESLGRPDDYDYCVKQAGRAPVFIFLVGTTYPARGTGPGGIMVSHGEYLAALAADPPPQIFVFLIGEQYQHVGTAAEVSSPKLRDLLRTIAAQSNRCLHSTIVLPLGTPSEYAERIHREVSDAVRHLVDQRLRSLVGQSIDDRLERVITLEEEAGNDRVAEALVRLAMNNSLARETFRSRLVPTDPFDRSLFRLDDTGTHKIADFESRLAEKRPGTVLGLVSASGQGKSTFICDFPRRHRLKDSEYAFLTGRELHSRDIDNLFIDIARVVKSKAPIHAQHVAKAPRPFYLLVDALNECSRADSLLLNLIIWLETLSRTAAFSRWPLVILLTMRPDIAKTVPELSRELVRPGNTYDLEPFGEKEYKLCAERFNLQTPWESLRPSTKRLLEDPFMLAITAAEYRGREVPLHESDVDLLRVYVDRLARAADADRPDPRVLEAAWAFAGILLDRNVQTLTDEDLTEPIDRDSITRLLAAGILTDTPERALGVAGIRAYGFRYDRVAEFAIGRHMDARLRKRIADVAVPWQGEPLPVGAIVPRISGLSEMHWTGLTLGFLFFLGHQRSEAHRTLIPLMEHADPAWRMLARSVLLRMHGTHHRNELTDTASLVRALLIYARDNPDRKGFRAELMRTAFELVRQTDDREWTGDRAGTLEELLAILSAGLNSKDQEIADLSISSLSLLIARPTLVPMISRQLASEIEQTDLSIPSIVGAQALARIKAWLGRALNRPPVRRARALPVYTLIRLLTVCFAAPLDAQGRAACLKLAASILTRLHATLIGRAIVSGFGRRCMLFLFDTILDFVLRSNRMPINAVEWKQILENRNQFDGLKRAMRWVDPMTLEVDADAIGALFDATSPNPFVYQTLVTALSTKYELAPALRAPILDIVKRLRSSDRGDGLAKYVASLVLYHINTFGTHGNADTAKQMTELSIDILQNHDGLVAGTDHRYNSNIIGTTGRSLLHLEGCGTIQPEDGGFSFIRSQISKALHDRQGEFTRYLIDNLALLGVLLPENLALMRLMKEEIYDAKLISGTGAPDGRLGECLVDAFVRIRAVHPAAVDNYLLRRDENRLYVQVRERHAQRTLEGDALGLDAEIISWAFERIVFDLLTRAPNLSSRAILRWCADVENTTRPKPSSLVDLTFVWFEEGVAWAAQHLATLQQAHSNSASKP